MNLAPAELSPAFLQKVVDAIKKEKLSVAGVMLINNPTMTIKSLHSAGILGVRDNTPEAADNALKLALYKGELNTVANALRIVPYNPNAGNLTTNPQFWAALGLTPGDFNGLITNYF